MDADEATSRRSVLQALGAAAAGTLGAGCVHGPEKPDVVTTYVEKRTIPPQTPTRTAPPGTATPSVTEQTKKTSPTASPTARPDVRFRDDFHQITRGTYYSVAFDLEEDARVWYRFDVSFGPGDEAVEAFILPADELEDFDTDGYIDDKRLYREVRQHVDTRDDAATVPAGAYHLVIDYSDRGYLETGFLPANVRDLELVAEYLD